MGAAGDQHQVGDAALHERLDGVADHRAIEDREQVLVGDPGEGMEPAAGAAGQDHSFQVTVNSRRAEPTPLGLGPIHP